MARLWLPVVASVLIATLLVILTPRIPLPIQDWQWEGNAHYVELRQALSEATLTSLNPRINGPLWSLSWEMAFSILLPIFVWIAVLMRRTSLVVIGSCIILVDLGIEWHLSPLKYLPVLLIGTVAAVELHSLRSIAARIDRSRKAVQFGGPC